MLLLADWPLAVPTREVLDTIEARISVAALGAFAARSWPGFGTVGLATPTAYHPWPPQPYRINRFYWPTGASRFAWGLFLTDTRGADAISDAAFGVGRADTKPVTLHLSSVDDQGTPVEKVETDVYVMPPIPLFRVLRTDGSDASFRGMYLLAVADERVYWRDYPTLELNIGESATVSWDDILTTLTDSLGITFEADDIEADYLLPSAAVNLTHEPIPLVLDAILASIGHRLVKSFDGKYATQAFDTALDAWDDDLRAHPDRTLRAGGNLYADTL
jgi:hypothetical protein